MKTTGNGGLGIARHGQQHLVILGETKWGQVILYLRSSSLLTIEEENGFAGVYKLVSACAHKHVGLTEKAMVRLGRSLAFSACYFLIKLHDGQP